MRILEYQWNSFDLTVHLPGNVPNLRNANVRQKYWTEVIQNLLHSGGKGMTKICLKMKDPVQF